ncbi:hypothetical protein FHR84_000834 [Actinopolyspora biskrensis]|uniref:Uncharacterized protein n=1 Tax=Actinopolyspora biskrensis TaxID=1470178 RepID=A0A852YTV6_9ACTN|nr:hypothetical protein [Actinopolyspora biskrensis]NYH77520.1 hypothetical protein [Actinopolyspora biskrensis]
MHSEDVDLPAAVGQPVVVQGDEADRVSGGVDLHLDRGPGARWIEKLCEGGSAGGVVEDPLMDVGDALEQYLPGCRAEPFGMKRECPHPHRASA